MNASDVWAEAERAAAQWFARAGAGPATPETEWMDRFAVASAAAQAFAKRCEQTDKPLDEANAKRLVEKLHACFQDGVDFNTARTFDEAIKRALDPKRKDRVRCRDQLDARLDEYIDKGGPVPPTLLQWREGSQVPPEAFARVPAFHSGRLDCADAHGARRLRHSTDTQP